MRRSLSFTVNTSVEDQDASNERGRGAQPPVEHAPAEEQLRNECEKLWEELNNVSLKVGGD